jgi:hypothetical protein
MTRHVPTETPVSRRKKPQPKNNAKKSGGCLLLLLHLGDYDSEGGWVISSACSLPNVMAGGTLTAPGCTDAPWCGIRTNHAVGMV